MNGKNLLEGRIGATTQESSAVKTLIEYATGKTCEELPAIFKLADGAQLTRSSKGDVFYYTSEKVCTCPGFCYRRSCKHVKALLSGNTVEASRAQARAYQARQRDLRAKAKASSLPEPKEPAKKLARPPEEASIRPDMRGFKPISPLPGEERAKSTVDKMLIDLHDTLPSDLPYWQRKDAVEMLKSEA
jgi:hypothetical protein